MDPGYNLIFVHLFDLILLAGLFHYYRRLGYRFLLYGAIAMTVAFVHQTIEHSEVLESQPVLGGMVEGLVTLAYAAFLLICVNDMVKRPFQIGVPATLLGVYFFIAGITVLWGEDNLVGLMGVRLPGLVMLGYTAFILARSRNQDSIGELWLSGLMVLGICIGLVEPIYVSEGLGMFEVHVFDDVVHLLIGAALLMITSETTIKDLINSDERIEEYAEERRRLEMQFSHAQKLESLGVLAGGIAHDFNNMLTSILGYASLAMKKLPNDSEIRKDLYMVMSGARQAVDLTSQMLIYAGKGALEFEGLDITKVVDSMSSLIHSIVPRKIQLVQKLARDLPHLKGDNVQLGQVVMNLIANAVDAIEEDAGLIEVSTGLTEVDQVMLHTCFFASEREPGAYLYVRVRDTGIGMTEEQVERIFDPFYSEKQSNRGLGLASLSSIVRQHKGFIRVRSTPGEGSDFTVYFPVVAYEELADGGKPAPKVNDGVKGSVLLADDDPRIRSLMVSILESDSFKMTWAEDGKEALKAFEQQSGQFDLLVLDCTMPKMSGAEVYRKIRAEGFNVPVVLVSGYHQEQVAKNIRSDPHAYFIKKPFNVDDFLAQVHIALDAKAQS